LEETHRFHRLREDVSGGPRLWSLGLRQVIACEGWLAAAIGEACVTGLHRGDPGRHGERTAERAAESRARSAARGGSGRLPGGNSRGTIAFFRSEGAFGPGPVRAVAACETRCGEHRTGRRLAA